MKHFFRKNWGIILAAAIYAGTFILDTRAPLGIIVWILYFIPVLLDFPISSRLLLRLSLLATILTFLELFKGTALIPLYYAVFNRVSGMVTLWLATWMLLRRRSVEESRKQVELQRQAVLQTLEAERVKLQATLDSLPVGVWLAEPNGRIVKTNEQAKVIWGPLPESDSVADYAEYKGWWPDTGVRLRAEDWALARALIRGETIVGQEINIQRFDGGFATIVNNAAPIRDDEGRILGAVVVVQDITERKRVEAELKESEERCRAMVDAIPQLAWIARADGHIYWYNQGWYDYTGTTPEQMEGWGWQSVHDPDVLPEVLKKWKEAIAEGKAFEMVFPLKGADGRFRRFLTRILPVKDAQGKVTQWFGTNTDVDVLKRVEDALHQSQEELENALVARTDFISRVSHELRTPLTAVSQGIDVILRGITGRLNSQQEDLLKLASRNVQRLNSLIGDVLDFQRLDAGKEQMVFERNDLNKVLQEVCDSMRIVAEKKGLGLSLELKEAELAADFDYNKIVQVMNNLLNNALKFTDKGRIIVHARRLDGSLEVTVRDSGIGIKKEDLNKLFREFVQVSEDSRRKAGGTGLGLIISKKIVEAHGGRIWIESEHGKGTSVYFMMPARKTALTPST